MYFYVLLIIFMGMHLISYIGIKYIITLKAIKYYTTLLRSYSLISTFYVGLLLDIKLIKCFIITNN